ncbi:pyridoxal phosphate-dependent aminotransferase [Fluviispira multicolorata]|uniref:Aminotransferase class I/II-fold pyridoxal phosphate-dependent enzyme n=1 Tax=Fluviispira multicolorata TaxID=2654512 RepID=A0A833JHZ0_9BACT|nr:pyridoxal phosphate-dependent aminotransferase [Fluviispira multicolorata]KAB8033717.1 aminotransferase class I/II-fold pyridoxal phosphate-dependent enzyme [Fluviispira multicolorata]
MKALNTFIMEDWLETYRFNSRFNLGESGGSPRHVKDLLLGSDLTEEQASQIFLNTILCDSPNRGRDDLRNLIADFHPGSTRENVLITTGTSEALFLLFRYLSPNKIALPLPAFQLLYELPSSLGASVIPLPIRFLEDGSPYIDEKEWIQILEKNKPDCLLINNPHNPSGYIFEKIFLQQLANTALKIDCKIIGDEHYRFLSSERNILGETVYKPNGNTFITGSFIKCFGVPGLRIGWCVGPKNALDTMQNEKNYTTHTVNPITEWISLEVLKNKTSTIFKTIKDEWIENKTILNDFLKSSNTVYGVIPQGGLVTVLGFKKATTQKESNTLIQRLIDAGVFVLPLSSMEFGKYDFQNETTYKEYRLSNLNKGFGFRLGLGCAPTKFKLALKEIERILLEN